MYSSPLPRALCPREVRVLFRESPLHYFRGQMVLRFAHTSFFADLNTAKQIWLDIAYPPENGASEFSVRKKSK